MGTAVDLSDVDFNGLIREDVMNKIWQIDNIPLPLTSRVGSDSHENQYCEWTTEELAALDADNAFIDGADTDSIDDSKLGDRQGNHSQISVKVVNQSTRAQAVDTIGYANALTHQISQRQKDLRRNVETIMLTTQGSVKSLAGTAPRSAGLGAWIKDNTAIANGTTAGGFNFTTGIVDPRTGSLDASAVALTESDVRAVSKLVYKEGGESTVMMSTPDVCEQFSQYLFTSSARVAALQSDVNQQRSAVTATGAVNVFVSDFSTLEIVSNRLQLPDEDDVTTPVNSDAVVVYIIDPSMLRLSFLSGYRVEPLAKTGLSDKRQMCVDWSLKVLNSNAQGAVFNVDQTAPVTAN